ncbi:hypothetical protein GCM10011507_31900 [Edaphobacter acidisoli]|uniref:Uncharacterized protein n=1 Tax=Edaphobacter acidisoli TaxID=2040573 RepID=A0A916S1Y5_9BACT|nr:hypothetical protein GCM10011507_31900 [Edaphobacter acidisoli]
MHESIQLAATSPFELVQSFVLLALRPQRRLQVFGKTYDQTIEARVQVLGPDFFSQFRPHVVAFDESGLSHRQQNHGRRNPPNGRR